MPSKIVGRNVFITNSFTQAYKVEIVIAITVLVDMDRQIMINATATVMIDHQPGIEQFAVDLL